MCRRLARVRSTKLLHRCHPVRGSLSLRVPDSRSRVVLRLDVQSQVSQFFSVRVPQVGLRARAPLCALANAARCIPRERVLLDRGRLVSAQDYRRPDRRVPAAGQVARRADQANDMFRVG